MSILSGQFGHFSLRYCKIMEHRDETTTPQSYRDDRLSPCSPPIPYFPTPPPPLQQFQPIEQRYPAEESARPYSSRSRSPVPTVCVLPPPPEGQDYGQVPQELPTHDTASYQEMWVNMSSCKGCHVTFPKWHGGWSTCEKSQ
mgnify:CR=1 FL=1